MRHGWPVLSNTSLFSMSGDKPPSSPKSLFQLIDIEVNSLEQDLRAITLGNVLYLQITWHNVQSYTFLA